MAEGSYACAVCQHWQSEHLAGIGRCCAKDCTRLRDWHTFQQGVFVPLGMTVAQVTNDHGDRSASTPAGPCAQDEQVANEIADEAPNPLLPANIQHTHTMSEACKPTCPAYDGPPIIKTTVSLAGVADMEIPPGVRIADGLPNLPAELGDFGRWEQALKLLGLEINQVITLSLDVQGVQAKLRYPNGNRMPLFFEVTYPPLMHTKPKSDEGGLFNPH